jgi:hypothetical protein
VSTEHRSLSLHSLALQLAVNVITQILCNILFVWCDLGFRRTVHLGFNAGSTTGRFVMHGNKGQLQFATAIVDSSSLPHWTVFAIVK